MRSDVRIAICGDICATADTVARFDKGDVDGLMREVSDLMRATDIRIANLEYVLSDDAAPRSKIGPVLRGPARHAEFLAKAGFTVMGLANNHIGDCGDQGVLDTIAACRAAGLVVTGAGPDSATAAEPLILEKNGWRIGIMAVAEHEFNAASSDRPGAHIFDPYTAFETVRTLKKATDVVIVMYHGGIEYYEYPSPLLQKKAHAFVDAGADLVLCQHSHCIGTLETYRDGNILYGQGNAVYGYRASRACWNAGLIADIRLVDDGAPPLRLTLVPTVCQPDGTVRLAGETEGAAILEAVGQRTRQIAAPGFIARSWERFCDGESVNYLPHIFGIGKTLTRANRVLRGWMVRTFYTRHRTAITMNIVRCDAHREVVQTVLERRSRY